MRSLRASWVLPLVLLSCASRPPVAATTTAPSRSVGALPGFGSEVPSALLPAASAEAPMTDAERLPVGRSPARGSASALVTVVVFSDFQCPFCARVVPTLDALRERYGDDLRVVWKNNPLPFHDRARPAAEAAMVVYAKAGAAAFWAFHDTVFAHQNALSDDDLAGYAEQAGVPRATLQTELARDVYGQQVAADMALAAAVGAGGTPNFFINGTQLVGAQPLERFSALVDAVRARARAITPRETAYAAMVADPVSSEPSAPARPAPAPVQAPMPDQVLRVPVDGAPARGSATALVTMVVFSDFQCPYCSRVNATLASLRQRYGDDLRVVWRHEPLPFHPNARPAAEAAAEAFAQQGNAGFWRLHDLLFAHQAHLDRADLEGYAQEAGLDLGRFRSALNGHTHEAAIAADEALARSLEATGTPHFFINGRRLVGAQPEATFGRAVDAARADARAFLAAHPATARAGLYGALMTAAEGTVRHAHAPAAPAPADDPNHVFVVAPAPGAPSFGPATARVVIEHFTDLQCPFCARVAPTIAQIRERYGDRVRFVWRAYPLPFHAHAMPAAEAALEAFAQQGNAGFDRFRDAVFGHQPALEAADLERYAEAQGLHMARFRAALSGHTHQAAIRRDMAAADATGASIGTPAFFINGRFVAGALPFEEFQRRIDAALAAPR